MEQKPKAQRRWLVFLVVGVAGAGALYSVTKRATIPSPELDSDSSRPKLIEFGMGVCVQCKRMRPVMERAERELVSLVDVHVLDIRNEKNEMLAERHRMRVMPLVVLVDGSGKELWRHEGFVSFADLRIAVSSRLEPAREH